jgi:hypothetical protein
LHVRGGFGAHAACARQAEEEETLLVGPDGTPLRDPLGRPLSKDHNPRDGQLPPPGVGGHTGKPPQTVAEKLAQRRMDELKWLVEFAEKVRALARARPITTRNNENNDNKNQHNNHVHHRNSTFKKHSFLLPSNSSSFIIVGEPNIPMCSPRVFLVLAICFHAG